MNPPLVETLMRAKPTVWIVDDSALDAERARRGLVEHYETMVFTDGSSALEQLATGHVPDLLVVDWVMPGISGIELVQFLRAQVGPSAEVPVLLLTGNGQPEQIVEGLDAGANDYLAKPYVPRELQARIAALLRSAQLTERALAAERAVTLLLENAPDGLVTVDASGVISFANAEAGKTFGCRPAALHGKRATELLPGLSLAATAHWADVVIGDRIFAPVVGLVPTDTQARTIALRDVTARRAAEDRRLDFYSIIAHDLRTPLGAVLLRTHLMMKGKRGAVSPELIAELERTERSLASMSQTIDDFLDLAKLDGNAMPVGRSRVSLPALVTQTLEELHPLSEARALRVVWSPPEGSCDVAGDEPRLGQVLANLVGNAIKFTPANGTLTLAVERKGDLLEFSVTDTGPGIAPDSLPKLFDRFSRADSTASDIVGSGLGLMIVRQVIGAHGGNVGVESELGRGSRFWFSLPSFAAEASVR